jgi:formylglycine-generating enzyme required for sulfatase activity
VCFMRNKTTARIMQRFGFIALIAVIEFTTTTCSKAAAQSTPGTKSKVPEIPGMVWIQPGTFMMGSPESEPGRDDDETQYQVRLTKGFYLGKYPVTQAQYQAVMKTNPSRFKSSSGGDNPMNRPVDQVSWYDAIVFCNRLSMEEGLNPAYRINGSSNSSAWGNVPNDDNNATWDAVELVAGSNGYRLPTEAQWEYACRAGTTTAFNWGTDNISSSAANYDASEVDAYNTAKGTYIQRTTEVGSYAPNAWGLYDMHGNVIEGAGIGMELMRVVHRLIPRERFPAATGWHAAGRGTPTISTCVRPIGTTATPTSGATTLASGLCARNRNSGGIEGVHAPVSATKFV